jgi:hypothetical protein
MLDLASSESGPTDDLGSQSTLQCLHDISYK